ncbi:response regulator transcription factor [Arthrobacter globiformis]|uniref:response regulator transcription factor n=1 Tax=Arthrobacter globiformis TaxID=1665 RepID=UPI00278ADCEA|nr:response regulator [Arthrobacter globiformis]MDQ0864736.1 DNA-binding response OmpR family regulator [Arthrobacter globiformis]
MPFTRTAVVIEDDGDMRGLIEAVLGLSGVAVRTAATGAGGVEAVSRHSPDIVILDFGLPDVSGLEVIARIRAFSKVYILMLTGRDDLSETLLAAGANAVFTKPFRPRALRAQVEEMLGLQHQEL